MLQIQANIRQNIMVNFVDYHAECPWSRHWFNFLDLLLLVSRNTCIPLFSNLFHLILIIHLIESHIAILLAFREAFNLLSLSHFPGHFHPQIFPWTQNLEIPFELAEPSSSRHYLKVIHFGV